MFAQTASIVIFACILAIMAFFLIMQTIILRKGVIHERKTRRAQSGGIYTLLQDSLKNNGVVFYTASADKPYNITFITDNCKELSGYSAESIISGETTVKERIHPIDLDIVAAKHNEIYYEKKITLLFRFLTAKYEYIWLDAQIFLWQDEASGQPMIAGLLSAAAKDSNKQWEIQKSREYFRSLFEHAGVALMIVNRNGTVADANDTARALLGIYIFGYHVQNCFDAAGARFFEDAIISLNKADDGKKLFECTLIGKNRKNRYVHCVLNFLDEEKSLYMLQIIDITEYKNLLEQMKTLVAEETKRRLEGERLLEQKAKMAEIGEMIDAIIHQWKQPLSALFICAEMMKDDLEKETINRKDLEMNLEQITQQLTFMLVTIDTFRNFFKAKDSMETFSITAAIENVRLMLSGVFYHNNITVRLITDLNEEELIITGNMNEMQQVILNLLMNSKDAVTARREQENNPLLEGLVSIEITREERRQMMTFTDNGGGVPADMIDSVFEPYFTTKSAEGTGIGLHISKLIVSKYKNGNMAVRNVENGAQFVISMDV